MSNLHPSGHEKSPTVLSEAMTKVSVQFLFHNKASPFGDHMVCCLPSLSAARPAQSHVPGRKEGIFQRMRQMWVMKQKAFGEREREKWGKKERERKREREEKKRGGGEEEREKWRETESVCSLHILEL